MPLEPHLFWQTLAPPGTHPQPAEGYTDSFPAALPDRRELLLPLRVLPGAGNRAVASLIVNQASFAVEDGLADAMAALAEPLAPDIVIAVPTLGLTLANALARRLGHDRLVPLGTSRKFWYRDEWSEPMSSITSPTHAKTLFIDPRSLPLLQDRRVLVVDDVISSGASMRAVLRLLEKASIVPVGILAAMLQGTHWHEALAPWRGRIHAPLASPVFAPTPEGRWQPLP